MSAARPVVTTTVVCIAIVRSVDISDRRRVHRHTRHIPAPAAAADIAAICIRQELWVRKTCAERIQSALGAGLPIEARLLCNPPAHVALAHPRPLALRALRTLTGRHEWTF